MKKRNRGILAVVIAVVIILCVSLLYFFTRNHNQAQHHFYKGVDLEAAFYEQFPENYTEILWVREEEIMVFLGCYGGRQDAHYVYYEKIPFFDCWIRGMDGMLGMDNPSVMLQSDGLFRSNRIYLSLNSESINKVVVKTDGEETVFRMEPENSFIVVTEDGIDGIDFFTEEGEKISERKFLERLIGNDGLEK